LISGAEQQRWGTRGGVGRKKLNRDFGKILSTWGLGPNQQEEKLRPKVIACQISRASTRGIRKDMGHRGRSSNKGGNTVSGDQEHLAHEHSRGETSGGGASSSLIIRIEKKNRRGIRGKRQKKEREVRWKKKTVTRKNKPGL